MTTFKAQNLLNSLYSLPQALRFILVGGAAAATHLLAVGVLVAAGAGAGSFSILIGAMAQRLPAEKRAFASGFINAIMYNSELVGKADVPKSYAEIAPHVRV